MSVGLSETDSRSIREFIDKDAQHVFPQEKSFDHQLVALCRHFFLDPRILKMFVELKGETCRSTARILSTKKSRSLSSGTLEQHLFLQPGHVRKLAPHFVDLMPQSAHIDRFGRPAVPNAAFNELVHIDETISVRI